MSNESIWLKAKTIRQSPKQYFAQLKWNHIFHIRLNTTTAIAMVDAIEIPRQISGHRDLNIYYKRRKSSFNHVTSLNGNTDHLQSCFVTFLKKSLLQYVEQHFNGNPATDFKNNFHQHINSLEDSKCLLYVSICVIQSPLWIFW